MFVWLASYPKSGNTWLRSMIASYFYTKDGEFNFEVLDNIDQFPTFTYFENYKDKFDKPKSTAKYWLDAQVKINEDKKIKFFKTHNAFCKVNNSLFTDQKNTLGAIYIVRDPRNIVTSIANHYDKNIQDALEFMKDEERCLLYKNRERYLGFVALFSWILHQKSWVQNKQFPTLIIKYEDMQTQTFKVFEKVINFIRSILKTKVSFDREKAKKVVQSCNFNKMQKLEKIEVFRESVMKKDGNSEINFFNLGPKNNFKELLDKGVIKEMNIYFRDQLKEFKYE